MEFVHALVCVCNDMNQDRILLATSLLQLFRHENKEASLIRKFLEMDVDAAGVWVVPGGVGYIREG